MYISHLLHTSFILGSGRTAMTILVCDQWQKYKLMWKDGGAVAILNKLATEGPTEKVTLHKSQQRGTCVPGFLWGWWSSQSQGQARKPWGVSVAGVTVEQGGSMVGAQRGRGETGTQLWGAIVAIWRTWMFLWMRRKTSGGVWNLIVVVVAFILSYICLVPLTLSHFQICFLILSNWFPVGVTQHTCLGVLLPLYSAKSIW